MRKSVEVATSRSTRSCRNSSDPPSAYLRRIGYTCRVVGTTPSRCQERYGCWLAASNGSYSWEQSQWVLRPGTASPQSGEGLCRGRTHDAQLLDWRVFGLHGRRHLHAVERVDGVGQVVLVAQGRDHGLVHLCVGRPALLLPSCQLLRSLLRYKTAGDLL